MRPKDAEGIANSVDLDQTAPLGAVWSGSAVCPDLSVWKLRVIMIIVSWKIILLTVWLTVSYFKTFKNIYPQIREIFYPGKLVVFKMLFTGVRDFFVQKNDNATFKCKQHRPWSDPLSTSELGHYCLPTWKGPF